VLAGGIETALGGAFLATLWDDADGMGPKPQGDVHHFAGRRHFEIERTIDARLEPRNIIVTNVAAILPQVRRNAVGAGRDGDFRGTERIRMLPSPRIAHRGDVIDVDAETKLGLLIREFRCVGHVLPVHPFRPGDDPLRPQLRNDGGEMLEVVDLKIDRHRSKIRGLPAHADVIDVTVVVGDHLGDLR
jgi:hypothetical protein